MTTIQGIMQVGVGVPDRERFEDFARDLLGFSVRRSRDGLRATPGAGTKRSNCSTAALRSRFQEFKNGGGPLCRLGWPIHEIINSQAPLGGR